MSRTVVLLVLLALSPIDYVASKGQGNNKKFSSTPSTTGISSQYASSLRRIREEYKDAVTMGIAYDWVGQKRIRSKKKKKKKNASEETTTTEDPASAFLCLGPLTTNMRHWHFSFRGVGDVFGKGVYHGVVMLPRDYPLSPPRVQMWTPSGRFKPFTDICLSASAFHPESWTMKWTIFGLVNALRLHMLQSPLEVGGMTSTRNEMEKWAVLSLTWEAQFRDGDMIVLVSHPKLLKQGVLTVEDGLIVEQPPRDSILNETPENDGVDSLSNAVEKGKVLDQEVSMYRRDDSFMVNDVSTDKSVSNMDTRTKKKKQHSQMELSEHQQITRRLTSHLNHVILMTVSKTLTSPVKVVFISLLVLFWLYRK